MVGVGGRRDIFKGTLNKAIKESKQLLPLSFLYFNVR